MTTTEWGVSETTVKGMVLDEGVTAAPRSGLDGGSFIGTDGGVSGLGVGSWYEGKLDHVCFWRVDMEDQSSLDRDFQSVDFSRLSYNVAKETRSASSVRPAL